MFKIILYLLLIVVLISVLRSVIGVVTKILAAVLSAGSSTTATHSAETHQLGGDLHRDPVCGTYVAESTPHQRKVSGQVFYYCSEGCKERHALAAR
jgi:hypothetical protein